MNSPVTHGEKQAAVWFLPTWDPDPATCSAAHSSSGVSHSGSLLMSSTPAPPSMPLFPRTIFPSLCIWSPGLFFTTVLTIPLAFLSNYYLQFSSPPHLRTMNIVALFPYYPVPKVQMRTLLHRRKTGTKTNWGDLAHNYQEVFREGSDGKRSLWGIS